MTERAQVTLQVSPHASGRRVYFTATFLSSVSAGRQGVKYQEGFRGMHGRIASTPSLVHSTPSHPTATYPIPSRSIPFHCTPICALILLSSSGFFNSLRRTSLRAADMRGVLRNLLLIVPGWSPECDQWGNSSIIWGHFTGQ